MIGVYIGLAAAINLVVVWAIVRGGWGTLADKFPPREILPGAVRREFQSFSFDMFNFGLCVHAEADESHLHLSPAKLMRVFGCGRMSIPWSAMTPVKPGRVRAGGVLIRGPRWCLDLASVGDGGGAGGAGGQSSSS
ncbi:MAG: hypothetical protein HRU70_05665 [Phycisphaeraceae bacterium]|nr:MAG: hypothetical protein HRU70_05665 [Phycisphaeraceae bacterium]